MGAKKRYTELAVDDVLPLVGVGMPMQFAQATRFEVENNAGYGLRNRKAVGTHSPFTTKFVDRVRLLGQQTVFVRFRWGVERPLNRDCDRWRDLPAHKIDLIRRDALKRCLRHPEILR